MHVRYAPLLALLAGFLFAPTVQGQTYVGYYDIPGNPFVHDLTFHDGYIWGMHRSSATPRILQINPANGSIISQINLNIDFTPTGLAWDGTHFWVSRGFTSSNNRIYRIDTSGNIVDDIPAPSTPLANGLTWHDGFLWVSRANPNDQAAHVRVDPTDGTELQAVPSPWTQPAGMAFIGDGTMWGTNAGDDGTNIEKLYQLDLATGDMLQDLDMPEGIGRPRGLAFDGQNTLYMVANTRPGASNYRIYVIDLASEGNPTISLSPQSLNFGTVITGTTEDRTLTISNIGDGPLTISNVELVGDDEFGTGFDGATIPAGEQITVDFTFEPTMYGPHSGSLDFTTNDVAAPTVSVALTGFALYPQQTAGLVSDEHDFGAVRIAEPYADGGDRSVRTWPMGIINEGAETLSVSSISLTGPFHIEQDLELPVDISPADTFYVLVGFRPIVTGPAEGEATITTNDPQTSIVTVALSGTGIDPEMDGGDPIWTMTVPDNPVTSFQDRKVHAIRSMGDVTGDGTADLAIATRNYWVMGVRGNSWGTGEVLWTFNTCPNNFNCGSVSGVDGLYNTGLVTGVDLNEDGYNDVIVGTGGGNDHVFALSGKDGSVIWQHGDTADPYLASYYAVDARLDFTGDGIPDVVAGTGTASANSPNPYNQRRVYLISGATGEVVWVRQPNALVPNFVVKQFRGSDGSARVAAGGRNSDVGQGHVVAYTASGSLLWSQTAAYVPFIMATVSREDDGEDVVVTGNGALYKYDGDTGEPVWSILGMSTVWAIDVIGDITGSGVEDVVVGDFNGNVSVYDGLNGNFVWNAAMPAQAFGVSAIGDINLDGYTEIAVATANGQIRLLSGETGQTLWTYQAGSGQISQAGEVVTAIPDIDGNNAPEVAAGTRHGHIALLKTTGELLPTSGEEGSTPSGFALHAPYPNPTSAGAVFSFELPESAQVRVAVYDLLGRHVATVLDAERPAGAHEVAWNGRNTAGAPLAAGMYLVRLEGARQSDTQRIVIVR